ncbi:Carbohydrate binding module (family 6) [compost metagenome]
MAYHSSASNGAKVGHIDNNSSYVQFNVTVGTAGYYTVIARTDNGTSGGYGVWANFKLSVNGGAGSNFSVTNSAWDHWTNASAKVYLNAGSNTIRFTRDTNYAEIDSIDIMPW